jgi:hypothetical protein
MSIVYGLIITLSVGTLILAMSSLTRRSLYVGIAWFGLWTISGTVGASLTEIYRESGRREIYARELAAWVEQHPPPPGVQMRGSNPMFTVLHDGRPVSPHGVIPGHEDPVDRWRRDWSAASTMAWERARSSEGESAHDDWRPLCSYAANLDRIGEGLLNSEAAWVQIGRAVALAEQKARQLAAVSSLFGFGKKSRVPQPPPINERFLVDRLVPQYPWWWSGTILAALVGISTWILSRRVKSLDRLK